VVPKNASAKKKKEVKSVIRMRLLPPTYKKRLELKKKGTIRAQEEKSPRKRKPRQNTYSSGLREIN